MATKSQIERDREKKRMAYLRRELRKGRVPIPRKTAPNLEELYTRYGYTPGVDVFIPRGGYTEKQLAQARRRFKYEKYQKRAESPSLRDIIRKVERKNRG